MTKHLTINKKKIPVMPLEEFKSSGLLQECNRQFMHPLGVMLVLATFADGELRLFVTDQREEKPEGVTWEEYGVLKEGEFLIRSQHVIAQQERTGKVRRGKLGYIIEPLGRTVPQPAQPSNEEPTISMA